MYKAGLKNHFWAGIFYCHSSGKRFSDKWVCHLILGTIILADGDRVPLLLLQQLVLRGR